MLKEINTVFDFKNFEEAPIMADATRTERQWLIDAYLKAIPPWQIMEFYQAAGALEDLEHGMKRYALGDSMAFHDFATAKIKMRNAEFLTHDIDDIIYDAWSKREVGYCI